MYIKSWNYHCEQYKEKTGYKLNEKINILCAQKSFCAKVAPCRSSTFLKLSVNKAKAKFSVSLSSFAHHTAATSTAHTAGGKAGNPPPCQTPSVAYSFYISTVYITVTFTVWFIQKCRLYRKKYGHKQHFYFCPVVPWGLTTWSPIRHALTEVIFTIP